MPGGTQSSVWASDRAEAPVVSVIIVSWNAKDYLKQCLDSLAEGACKYPMEIVVVDNGSADESVPMVRREYPHVRLILNGRNLGFAKANNIGIQHTTGRYVCLINSDVRLLKGCITGLVDYCESHPQAGMVGPRILGGDGRLQKSCRGFPGLWNMFCRALALDTLFPQTKLFCGYALTHEAHAKETTADVLSGCFWLVRRKALEQVGLLDETFFIYGEDVDWCLRFWSAGWRLMFVPAVEAIHYGGASSAKAPERFSIELQKADLQFWAKHHSRPAVLAYFLIACLYHLIRMTGFTLAGCLRSRKRSDYWHKMRLSFVCLRWLISNTGSAKPQRQIDVRNPQRVTAVAG